MDRKIDKKTLGRERRVRILKWSAGVAAAILMAGGALVMITPTVARRDFTLGGADRGPLETTVVASGRVVPAYEEVITSPVATRVIKVYAQAGDSVAAGTPLLQLDLRSTETAYGKLLDEQQVRRQELRQQQLNSSTALSELEMQIKVKEMEVSRLEVEVVNERRLDSIGSGTGDRVRQAETACATGRLELEQLRSRLANERLRSAAADHAARLGMSSFDRDVALMRETLEQGRIPAPHAGVLTFIVNEIGAQLGAGDRVAVVSDLSQFRVQGEVPEGSSDRVNVGSEVTVRIGGTELSGMVSNITPQAKAGVVQFVVTLADPRNPRLRSGLRTEMYVSYGYKDEVLRIPNGPYFKGPGEYSLFVKDGAGRLVRRKMRLGDSNRRYVEVLSGLNPGDSVVVSDMEQYNNSDKLNIEK